VVGSLEREEDKLGNMDRNEDLSSGSEGGAASGLTEVTRRAGVEMLDANGKERPGISRCCTHLFITRDE